MCGWDYAMFIMGQGESEKKGSCPCPMSVREAQLGPSVQVASLLEATSAPRVLRRVGLPPAGPGHWAEHDERLGKVPGRTSAKVGL